jgi:hypothetical protein
MHEHMLGPCMVGCTITRCALLTRCHWGALLSVGQLVWSQTAGQLLGGCLALSQAEGLCILDQSVSLVVYQSFSGAGVLCAALKDLNKGSLQ